MLDMNKLYFNLKFVLLSRYIKSLAAEQSSNHSYYISMAANLSNPDEYFGALRNAQQLRVFFPGWKLKVYTTESIAKSVETKFDKLSQKISAFNGEIIITEDSSHVPLPLLSYLIQDDPSVEAFVIRSPLTRLSDRDATAVKAWLQSTKAIHCIRDHPVFASPVLFHHLWGAKNELLQQILGNSMEKFISGVVKEHKNACGQSWHSVADSAHLVIDAGKCVKIVNENLWEAVLDDVDCHGNASMCKHLPKLREYEDFVGQPWDKHGTALNISVTFH